jgi:hypothetical protein
MTLTEFWESYDSSGRPTPPTASNARIEETLRGEAAALGVRLNRSSLDRALERVKVVAAKSGEVSTEQIRSIIDEVTSGSEILEAVTESFR